MTRTTSMLTEQPKNTSLDTGEIPTDRISQLPDDILVGILWSLTMKEAGRTSVLSNRWRYLWTSYPTLNFDASKFIYKWKIFLALERSVAEERIIYLNWVDQVVSCHKGHSIDQFMIQFPLVQSQTKHIDVWVEFALKKNVRHLTLDLYSYSSRIDGRYNFPDIVNQQHMYCNLTSIRLVQVNVTGEVLGYLLANCPLLDRLVVHQSSSLSNLEVSAPSLAFLELRHCFNMNTIIVYDAPNLVSFVYHGPKLRIQLNDVPKLVDMSFGLDCSNHFTSKPLEFYSFASQLEVLSLYTIYFEEHAIATEFPEFANLKHLVVRFSLEYERLLVYASLIKACPSLCKFSLKLDSCKGSLYSRRPKLACPHYNLKVVEVVGFVGQAAVVEFVSYLIKSAVVLEEIIFDTRLPLFIGTPREFEETAEKAAARRQAQQLVEKLGPGVTSVII